MTRAVSAAGIAEYIARTMGRKHWPYSLSPEVAAELDRLEASRGPRVTGGNKHYRYDHSGKAYARRSRYNSKRYMRRLRERIAYNTARLRALEQELGITA
jgi:hypothetical protein